MPSGLDTAKIPTFVVAGNHDHNTVPDLIENLSVSNVHLLGADGEWERYTVADDDEPRYHVDGWSFPGPHVYESPFETYESDPADEPTIGVIHADLDSQESDYAPIQQRELESTSVRAWVLGHIHTPGVRRKADPTVFYPGSPQALDPGERGTHGPWLLEYGPAGGIELTQIPLARVCYDTLTVDVSGIDDPKDIATQIGDKAMAYLDENVEAAPIEVFVARIELTGRTAIHNELTHQRTQLIEKLQLKRAGASIQVEQMTLATKPEIELDQFDDPSDPVGYLATLIQDLENNEHDDHTGVIQDSINAVVRATKGTAYGPLEGEGELRDPTEEWATDVLTRQARALLQELVEQKESPQ